MKKGKLKRAGVLMMACTLALSPVQSFALPVLAVESEQAHDADELRALVNPILQHYEPAAVTGEWKLSSSSMLSIVASDANLDNQKLADVVRLISSEMKDKGLSADFVPVRYMPSGNAASDHITIDLAESITDESTSLEAYKIEIDANGVRLTGASEAGVLNGLHTIEALLITNQGLPYGTIIDYPNVAERRIHVDCARKYISKDWFIRLIHEMSWMKMNALQMHFSENLGFRIECETDPDIVSDQYLTKAEVREILAEARKYNINIIPSFDSPGHVDQILKAHLEYGQVSSSGSHYSSGLDITNPEAIEYIKSLYAEYCELFEGCTDFHIGGDEYMEFDRAPFTTQYQSVLNAYAVEKYGTGYTWKDTVSGYINDLAEFVHEKGFTPRIWNDGIYYGHSYSSGRQKIEMHDYIGIDFWSQMGWNPAIAKLNAFIEMGHKKIYNINSSYFYYVLRPSMPTDGREQHSFDNLDPEKLIYNEWTPGKFSSNTIADDSDVIAGAAIGIWCDVPDLVEEDVIQDDIASPMRALASKAWNTSSPQIANWDTFASTTNTLGHAGAWTKGEKLDEAPAVLPSEDLGKLVLHFVDENDQTIAPDRTLYDTIGKEYTLNPDAIYGYQAISEPATGSYAEDEQSITFRYRLYTDWSELDALLDLAPYKQTIIPQTWSALENAIAQARELRSDANAHQRDVDAAVQTLQDALAQAVPLTKYALYAELLNPLAQSGWSGNFEAYEAALEEAQSVLNDANATMETIQSAARTLNTAKEALVPSTSLTPAVSASLPAYSTYAYSRMFDQDTSSFAWFDGAQEAGAHITFTFDSPVLLSSMRIQSPSAATDLDYIRKADVEISSDGETWTKVGEFEGLSRDSNITFEEQSAKAIRLKLTESCENWYKICEVSFGIRTASDFDPLKEKLNEASLYNASSYTYESFNALVNAVVDGQMTLSRKESDASTKAQAIQDAIDGLVLLSGSYLDYRQIDEAIRLANEVLEREGYQSEKIESLRETLRTANGTREYGNQQSQLDSAAQQLNEALLNQRRIADPDQLHSLTDQ